MMTSPVVNLKAVERRTCRYSGEDLPKPFLELGETPLANSYLHRDQLDEPEFKCPLSLTWAPESKLVQLTHVVPPELMFSNYLYVSSTSKTFQRHFFDYAKTVRSKLGNRKNVTAVDVGSNDGLLVSCYIQEGMKALGVEPAKNLCESARTSGLETLNCYFDDACAKQIKLTHGLVDVISANNVFAHIDNIHAVCRNVSSLLKDNGMFVIEFPYLLTMFDEMLYDMIYHEHLSYISLIALQTLLHANQLEIFSVDQVSSHGGSLRVFIQKQGGPFEADAQVDKMVENEVKQGYTHSGVYKDFAKKVLQTRDKLTQFVKDIKLKKQTIAGYGTPAKAGTIINSCGFTHSDIDFIVDDSPLKQGLFTPGAKIPIVSSKHLDDHAVDYVIIFAWNFAREILEKVKHLRSRSTRFMIPLPKPEIV